jgi:hypothetical protein
VRIALHSHRVAKDCPVHVVFGGAGGHALLQSACAHVSGSRMHQHLPLHAPDTSSQAMLLLLLLLLLLL